MFLSNLVMRDDTGLLPISVHISAANVPHSAPKLLFRWLKCSNLFPTLESMEIGCYIEQCPFYIYWLRDNCMQLPWELAQYVLLSKHWLQCSGREYHIVNYRNTGLDFQVSYVIPYIMIVAYVQNIIYKYMYLYAIFCIKWNSLFIIRYLGVYIKFITLVKIAFNFVKLAVLYHRTV